MSGQPSLFVLRFLLLLTRRLLGLSRGLLRTRVGRWCLVAGGLLAGIQSCGSKATLRVGTFNVREFGPGTDLTRLTELLFEMAGDVVALQEIQDMDVLRAAAARLSVRSKKEYLSVVSQCGGRRSMHVGFLYDNQRLRLEGTREFPELRTDNGGSCSTGARAGLLAKFSDRRGGASPHYSLLVVHFPAGGTPEQARERQMFWGRALMIAEQIRKNEGEHVMLLGDVNSTGYLDNTHNERDDIDNSVQRAGFRLLTTRLGCTEYYQPERAGPYVASHLDHIMVSSDVKMQTEPRALSFCASLRCARTDKMPADFHTVSDHCPVTVEIR